jgi:hypothetical protein
MRHPVYAQFTDFPLFYQIFDKLGTVPIGQNSDPAGVEIIKITMPVLEDTYFNYFLLNSVIDFVFILLTSHLW